MTDHKGILKSIEDRTAALFLAGGGMIAINAAIVTVGIATGSERMITLLGETFNAAGWAVVLIGLLGLYPGLADRSRKLARAGAVCAAIGVVVFTILSSLTFAHYVGVAQGDMQNLVPIILPGVILGGVLAFLLFSIVSLRTDIHPTSTGILLLLPAIIVIVNIFSGAAGFDSSTVLLGIVSALAVVMLTIGTRLRSYPDTNARAESSWIAS